MVKRLLIISITAFCGFVAAQEVTLQFRDSVLVDDKVIYLGEIADIQCDPENDLSKELAKIEVGNAAPAGFSRFISSDDVVQFIVKPKVKSAKILQTGAKRVKARTGSTSKQLVDYEERIVEYLEENIGWEKGDYSISIEDNQRQWHTYPGALVVEIKGLNSPYPRGNIQLKLVVTQGDKQQIIPFICKIRVETSVVTARNTISRNAIISETDLEMSRVDITGLRSVPSTDKSLVAGKMACLSLTPGTIIQEHCVKPVPEICEGDMVLMVMEIGQIKVSVQARAREQGIKGETIWVENPDTHKLIRVKVEGKGVVHLKQGESI